MKPLSCLGATTLSAAILCLLGVLNTQAQTSCTTAPSGLVSLWRGEGSGYDSAGTNTAVSTGVLFTPGEVGQAFSFNGAGSALRIPAATNLDVGNGPGLTIEAWIKPTDATLEQDLVEWNNSQGFIGTHFSLSVPFIGGGPGSLWANLVDAAGGAHQISTTTNLVASGVFQHVALTYNKLTGLTTLFLNGAVVAQTNLGSFTPFTSSDLFVGTRPSGVFTGLFYGGAIDELGLFNRELSTSEIQAIYQAASFGKCLIAPGIAVQPSSQVVNVGSSASFGVTATGDLPLGYQWQFNGTDINGATTSKLTLANVGFDAAGAYSVIVSNSVGSVPSSAAKLTVNAAPTCAPAPSGLVAWWPGEGSVSDVVNGNNASQTTGITFGPGEVGSAMSFDGTTSLVTVPGSSSLNVSNLTIEAWIFPTDSSLPRPIFEYADSTGLSALNFWYNIGSGAQPVPGAIFGFARDGANAGNNFYLASTGGVLPVNQWSHVAYVFDSDAMTAALFVNGVMVATNNFGIPVHPNTLLGVNIGYRPANSADLYGGFRHQGKLDEVSLYNRPLSAGEIQAIYQAGSAGKCVPLSCAPAPSGLVSWWQAASNALDSVGGNNGQVEVGANFAAGEVGTAFSFDGVSSKIDLGDPASLAFTNSFSIEGWLFVKALPPAGQGHGLILYRGDPRFCLDPYYLAVETSGNIRFHIEDAQDTIPCGVDLETGPVTLQQWLHVAAVFDSRLGAMQIYLNGSLAAHMNTTIAPFQNLSGGGTSIGNLSVGQDGMSFNGLIDELAVYDRALTSPEVQSIYNAGSAGKCVPLSCTSPPAGLVAWWKGDTNAVDSIGGNNGILKNDVGFVNGVVQQAFSFNGLNQDVEIPDSPALDPTSAMTLETWVYVSGYPHTDLATIVTKFSPYDPQLNQYQLETHFANGRFNFRPLLLLPSGYGYLDGNTSIQFNTWYHVAMTYDGSSLKLYVNGALDGSVAASGAITQTKEPLRIGGPGDGPWWFNGRVDEVSLYNRALTATEIQSIYSAAAAGKCLAPMPPSIGVQPQSQSGVVGDTANFSVAAAGSLPLSFQWFFNTAAIPGATSSSLVLSNISQASDGSYSVVVTNSLGSVTSAVAVLTVTLGPSSVQVGTATVADDGTVTVPINLVANGKENAVSFSLDFDSSLLMYQSAVLGSGAPGGSLLLNPSKVDSGQLGVALALPTASTFDVGAQQILLVSFSAPIVPTGTTTPIFFGDSPLKRQIADVSGGALSSTFNSGTIVLPPTEIEGDAYPRPDGDQTLTISDWVLVGRFVARLESPTNSFEFQRADCAPRATLGDGALTVSDWVQAGRYAAGLDPITRIGGPTAPISLVVATPASAPRTRKTETLRQVKIVAPALAQGSTSTVSVALDGQGDENALAFSLSFDPTKLAFTGATTGTDARGVMLHVNSSEPVQGRLGFVLALDPDSSFALGTKQLVNVNFRPLTSVPSTSEIAFGDVPVPRGVSDPNASVLATVYVDGSLVFNPPPSLNIVASGQGINLSWPASLTGFVLQESSDSSFGPSSWKASSSTPVTANGLNVVTVPLSATSKFYRLAQP